MKEEEKIFAGYMFDPRKQELREIKHKAHEACRQYNVLDEYDPRREEILRGMLGKVGQVFIFRVLFSLITVRILLLEKIFLPILI